MIHVDDWKIGSDTVLEPLLISSIKARLIFLNMEWRNISGVKTSFSENGAWFFMSTTLYFLTPSNRDWRNITPLTRKCVILIVSLDILRSKLHIQQKNKAHWRLMSFHRHDESVILKHCLSNRSYRYRKRLIRFEVRHDYITASAVFFHDMASTSSYLSPVGGESKHEEASISTPFSLR